MSDDISIPRPGFAARQRAQGLEPGTKRAILIAGGLAVGLAGVIGVSFLAGRKPAEVPVIQADTRPIRTKPDNPGGMQPTGLTSDAFSGGDGAAARLAAAPEVPDPKGLRATQPAAPPVVALTPPAVVTTAQTVATPVVTQPVAKPAAVQTQSPLAQSPAVAKPVAKPVVAGKGPVAQLAAVGSETSARTEWQALSKRMPDVLGGKQAAFSKVERDGKTYWRVRTGGFADIAAARSFCERVRAKGTGCSVIDI